MKRKDGKCKGLQTQDIEGIGKAELMPYEQVFFELSLDQIKKHIKI